jgi:lactoylglutathione lyase
MPSQQGAKNPSVISYWGVEDAHATFDKLVSLGAKPLNPISDVGGGIKLGVVTDPFGNPLGIIYNPVFKPE